MHGVHVLAPSCDCALPGAQGGQVTVPLTSVAEPTGQETHTAWPVLDW